MKISPLLGNISFTGLNQKSSVARDESRTERDAENGRDQYTRQQSGDQESENDSNAHDDQRFEASMVDALNDFQSDPQTQASGISASQQGNGPGLKVVVKNADGGVIRQFTGEEFLKLRQAISGEKKGRGKILDQKL